jgi:hypothetical protein
VLYLDDVLSQYESDIQELLQHHVKVKPIDFSKENPMARGP